MTSDNSLTASTDDAAEDVAEKISLDIALLEELGVSEMMSDDQRLLLEHLYGELEQRVGKALSEGLSDDQLEEFEALIDASDDEGSSRWLEENRPDYRDVVAAQFASLKAEVRAQSAEILAAAAENGPA